MKKALITGANKGIGFETAKILASQGYFVYIASRSLENAEAAVKQLKAEGFINLTAIQLDVTNQKSVDEARKQITALDVLVNNAGISGPWQQSALTSKPEDYLSVYDTNLFGVIRVTQAFVDLLKQSSTPRIVNVSTAMASLSLAGDFAGQRFVIYQSSKSALNMYTVQLAFELSETAFKVNAVCPGYTQTDFTGHQGTSTPQQAAQRIAKYVMIDQDGPTGKFFSEEYFPESVCSW